MMYSVIVITVIASLWLQVQGQKSPILDEDCGVVRSWGPRISNGDNAELAKNPWMAFLETPTEYNCAGTLINHWFVLTTAHCIPDDLNITVHLGEYNIKTKVDCVGYWCQGRAQKYDVDMAFKHMKYNSQEHSNDIGLLRLGSRVEYHAHILPICIFVDDQMKVQVDHLTWFTTTGWGKTKTSRSSNVLQTMRINRLPNVTCTHIFNTPLTSGQICAGNTDSSLCHGDSGGPQIQKMMYNKKDRYVQLGISSWINNKCESASIITDLSIYGYWIERVVRQFSPVSDMHVPFPSNRNVSLPVFSDFMVEMVKVYILHLIHPWLKT
ncbi:chymotrypsin-like protease CTRL-1 [Drosophila eugracilis]|uniref:chymotrypsin-like protease CTRL-1 n=1 Tax=Drosophila eugracilis TaxID=29029 RepID=UPI0007E63DB4|nr:chymotrypsin-like protease CTRL-1 [Drosophila eugracilis]